MQDCGRSVGARVLQDLTSTRFNRDGVPETAPIYQLLPQEVVMVAGCAPPELASDYFAATPYAYNAWSNVTDKQVAHRAVGLRTPALPPSSCTQPAAPGVGAFKGGTQLS